MSVNETPFYFGDGHALFGILCESDAEQSNCGVVLLNSGQVHRVGPFRLGVDISRALATAGFPVLRFDQSARGDSARRKGVGIIEAAELDVDSAKEALRAEAGVEKIILAGLCSGADSAVRSASEAEDVEGLILLDPYSPKTKEYYVRHYGPRLLNPRKVMRSASRKFLTSMEEAPDEQDDEFFLASIREFPTKEQSVSAFRRVKTRGGASLCVFTSGVDDYYNHHGQMTTGLELEDMDQCLEEVFFETAHHTYPFASHRKRLVETIVDFCRRHFA